MTAPCMAAPTASLCSSSSTSLTKRTTAKTCGTGTHAADAPRSRLSGIRAARLTRFALLCLLLFFGWTGVGKAVVPCKTSIPCKEVWFFNNSTETMYVVLVSGARAKDEWMQAFLKVPNATARQTAVWQTLKDYRIYVNGKTGIPPFNSLDPKHGYFKIRVPLFTQLLPFSQAGTGTYKDSLIDWWNGGRVAIYDTLGKDAIAFNYNLDVTNKNFIDPTTLPSGNQFVECLEGDCGEVKMFGGLGGLPGDDPTQLTEMTFGSALTDPVKYKDTNFGWIPQDVRYNVSAVDSVYMPVAMEPLNNSLIPYIGSVKPPADIRKILTQWVTDHPGWPVYKKFPANHPRIPAAQTVFLDAFLANDTVRTDADAPLTAPTAGGPIDNMIKLYLGCMKATPPLTDTCQKIQTLEKTLFQPNLAIYLRLREEFQRLGDLATTDALRLGPLQF